MKKHTESQYFAKALPFYRATVYGPLRGCYNASSDMPYKKYDTILNMNLTELTNAIIGTVKDEMM